MFIGPCSIKLLAGKSHPTLVRGISEHLAVPISRVSSSKQANSETLVTVSECLRDQDVYICQTGHGDINEGLMELLIMISGCKAASARRVTVSTQPQYYRIFVSISLVLPCFPYARQDKKTKPRSPITAKLVANLISKAGADHILTMDLHATQIKGFFKDIPVDNLLAEPLMLQYIRSNVPDYKNVVVVSPDAGGVKRATSISDDLGTDFAIIHKERAVANQVSRMVLVGNVRGRACIIIDDMADTCGTLCKAADTLTSNGAIAVYALIVHPILSGSAVDRIQASSIKQLVVCNTTPLSDSAMRCAKIVTIPVDSVFAEAIRRSHNGQSMSFLFKHAAIPSP